MSVNVKQLTLNLSPKCCDDFKPCEIRRFGVEQDQYCEQKQVCCTQLSHFPRTLAQEGGYEFAIAPVVVKVPPLQKVICAIGGNQGHRIFMDAVKDRQWAVPLQTTVAGDLNNTERLPKWRSSHGIAPDKWLVLHQESNDKTLESFARKTRHPNFFAILRADPAIVCISPGYSVYDDGSMCRKNINCSI